MITRKEIKKAIEREVRDREQREDPEGWLASWSGCRFRTHRAD